MLPTRYSFGIVPSNISVEPTKDIINKLNILLLSETEGQEGQEADYFKIYEAGQIDKLEYQHI